MSSQLITVADFIQLIKKNNAKVVQQVKGLDLSAKLITAVVPTLPDTGEEGILYFVPNPDGTGNNLYNEYLWIGANSKYEQVGSAEVDLSDYLKSADADNTYAKKTDLSAYAKTSALADYLTATNAANTYATKTSLSDYAKTSALSSYLTASAASNTYATKASLAGYATTEALSGYLTVVDAEADYLTKTSAASTYLTKTDATNTYATKSSLSDYAKTSALSSYLTASSASSTYATKASLADYAKTTALSAYLATKDASDTYLAKTDAASTYATVSALADYAKISALSSYLTTSAASNTYATKSSLSDYAKTSALSSYLTTANASNTYLSKKDASNTYATKAALTEAIGGVTSISYSVVSALPSSGSNGVIYLVPKSTSQTNNLYDEYIWLASSSKFEKIGDTAIDLSGYLTTSAASNTYATKSSIPTKVSQLTNDSGYKTTDTNTTYSLTQDSTDGHKLTFAGSDGSSKTITIPDNNTTYSAATQSANGLMTAADKTKLDGIATGANKYTLPAATASVLGGVKIGSNITVSSGTISLTKDNITAALGYTPPTTNTTYGVATTSANGLMSSTDKSKLDGIAAGANNYSLPAATASVLGGVKVGSNITVSSGTISLTKANVTAALGYTPPTSDTNTHYASSTIVNNSNTATANTTAALTNGNVYLNHIEEGAVKSSHKISGSGATSVTADASGNIVVSSTNTTYSAATQSANGLMSAADKKKLDGIATGANNYTYTLPAATADTLGGVKVGSNITNSSGTISLTKANVTAALGYTPPTKDTDTHYVSGTIVNNSNTATANTTTALANGNVYLNHIENGSVKNSHKISGSGATSVTTDTSGNITISSTNTTYSAATQSANGLMSAADKKKLDGIAAGANAYSLPAATASALGGVKVGSNITVSSGTISLTKANVTAALGYTPPTSDTNTHYASGTIVNNSATATANTTAALTNGNVYLNHIENGAVKNSHKISGSGATSVTTDTSGNIVISSANTTYSAATQSANGLMSAADKKKLDGITISNYVSKTNLTDKSISSVKIGSYGYISCDEYGLVIDSSGGIDGLTIQNTSTTNGYIYIQAYLQATFGSLDSNVCCNGESVSVNTSGSGTFKHNGNTVVTTGNYTSAISSASTSKNGLMSSSDKSKLNGIATGANNYSLPTASGSTLGGVKSGSSITDASGYTACPIIGGIPYYKPSSVTTTGGADPNIYSTSGINYTGSYSLRWGSNSSADGDCSAAIGYGVTAPGACSLSIGIYNKDHKQFNGLGHYSWIAGDEMVRDAFTIGNGTGPSNKSNAFRVTFSGQTYGLASFSSSGADYAEYVCEWADGNPDSEDRVGYMVTIKDGKLHKANDGDYILGVTSGNPSVVGNADETYFWKYERDDFNRILYAPIPKLDEAGQECLDEDGNVITINAMKVADNYDPDAEYIPRFIRPEWDYVGMVGVIPVRDDGTCVAGGFCKCSKDGIATAAEKKDFFTYYVKDRVSDGVVNAVIL